MYQYVVSPYRESVISDEWLYANPETFFFNVGRELRNPLIRKMHYENILKREMHRIKRAPKNKKGGARFIKENRAKP